MQSQKFDVMLMCCCCFGGINKFIIKHNTYGNLKVLIDICNASLKNKTTRL